MNAHAVRLFHRHASVIGGHLRAPALCATCLLALAPPAHAQVVRLGEDPVAPRWIVQQVFGLATLPDLDAAGREPEDMPVTKRQHPGYEPVGIRYGSWMFNPQLTARGIYDSNVYSSNTMKEADVAAILEPSLRAHTLWENHGIDVRASARSATYREQSRMDTVDATVRGNGWIGITRDALVTASFQASRLNEEPGALSAPTNAVEPTPYNYLAGDVTLRQQFNRLAASIGFGVDSYDFGSTRAANGSILNQDRRDGEIYTLHGRTDYALSPRMGLFTAAEVNQRNIKGTPTQPLGSDGYRVLGGFTMELTRLVTGEIGVGYMEQSFDSAAIGTIEGPAYRALLRWSPTRLLDIHFRAEQLVTQTSDTGATGVLATAFQAGADYELRRNLVLSVAGARENDRFQGQWREDNVTTVATQLKYLMNRFSSIALSHKYISRDSNLPSANYDKHQVGINVTAQF